MVVERVPRPSSETFTVDIHCVTKWSKLDTRWTGVPVEVLVDGVESSAEFVTASCDGGYTTNVRDPWREQRYWGD
jgi:DMSO/TMAO reductase YedYZ molybdopterin-dependent catalytic subunit